MNKNYFSDGIMRRMRQYTLALSGTAVFCETTGLPVKCSI